MLQSVVIAGFVALQGAVGCHNLLVAQKEGITSYVVIQLDLPIGDGPAQVSEHRCCPWATRWAPCPQVRASLKKAARDIFNGVCPSFTAWKESVRHSRLLTLRQCETEFEVENPMACLAAPRKPKGKGKSGPSQVHNAQEPSVGNVAEGAVILQA